MNPLYTSFGFDVKRLRNRRAILTLYSEKTLNDINIQEKHLDGAPRRVGELHGKPVFEVVTKGGWNMIVAKKGAGFQTLGSGPHRQVARHIAKKREPDIKLNQLSKSEVYPLATFADLLPVYEAATARMAQLETEMFK